MPTADVTGIEILHPLLTRIDCIDVKITASIAAHEETDLSQRVAILHYASPPTVGGVETVIAYHARGLADLGYPVRVISGSGAPFDARVEYINEPLFGSRHPDVLAVKQELDAGIVSPAFEALVERQINALRSALDGCNALITHNVHTLNKNLALTAALSRIELPRSLAWCHDLAWTNEQYQPELHDGAPWDLLRKPWPNTRYVTISEPRHYELAALLGVAPSTISVVPGGIDPARFFGWTDDMRRIEQRYHLLDSGGVLLLPARLTRRKNIALALHVLADLRARGRRDYRLVVTGPPGPHNPNNLGYLGELLELRGSLGLDAAAHFLYELSEPSFVPDDATISNLYQLADALIFPSAQEGFGLPMLEAGLAGVPIFCSDIDALTALGLGDAVYFDPDTTAPDQIAIQIIDLFRTSRTYRLRARARQSYRWDTLIRERLIPLLEAE
jgi:glycosyltransferase involved in cell wall biosynthesis